MKCPKCGQEVDDFISVCPYCGAELHQSSVNVPTGTSSGTTLTPENFRDAPTYKPLLIRLNIFGAVMLVFSILGLLGSLFARFVPLMDVVGIVLMIIGVLTALILFFGFFLTTNKKVFPQVNGIKLKGILEVLPAFWTAFTMVNIVGALVLQGIYFIIY